MRTASEAIRKNEKDTVAGHLSTVARAFIQAQQWRNDADYNIAREWTPVEVRAQITLVNEAFQAWYIIREEPAAKHIWFHFSALGYGNLLRNLLRLTRPTPHPLP